jgi:hypothetical protein
MPYADSNSQAAIESRRLSNQRYYQRNKAAHREKQKQAQRELQEWIENLKRGPCVDCKHTFPPCCMDWDHRDPATKVASVGELMSTRSKRRILAEITKCDLVCSNCHRIRTFKPCPTD